MPDLTEIALPYDNNGIYARHYMTFERSQALAAVESLTWRPIETAPKDGTIVLLYSEMWFAPVAAKYLGGSHWIATWDGDPIYSRAPTHWMPLPAPPTAKVTP